LENGQSVRYIHSSLYLYVIAYGRDENVDLKYIGRSRIGRSSKDFRNRFTINIIIDRLDFLPRVHVAKIPTALSLRANTGQTRGAKLTDTSMVDGDDNKPKSNSRVFVLS